MQEFPTRGGASQDGDAAPAARLFATFKLATRDIEMVRLRTAAGEARVAANVNHVGLVPEGFDCSKRACLGTAPPGAGRS